MKDKLTQEKLKELFDYNPETGVFLSKTKRKGPKGVGGMVGWINDSGYILTSINSVTYRVHRLAWLYMEGYFPENEIDHINRKKNDNRWVNLRHVTRQCNSRNSKKRVNNTSGVTGVTRHSKKPMWRSDIYINYKTIQLGLDTEFSVAVRKRWDAEIKYNFPNCNSTSSAYVYLKENNLLK